jgi:hypothetical protein
VQRAKRRKVGCAVLVVAITSLACGGRIDPAEESDAGIDAGTAIDASTCRVEVRPPCASVVARRFDPVRRCLEQPAVEICMPDSVVCPSVSACRVRLCDGATFLFFDACFFDGWQRCTEEQRELVMQAPSCDDV